MADSPTATVNCPMCAAFLFEGQFTVMRAPCCRGDVWAVLTDDNGIVVKWAPRLRGGRILTSAPNAGGGVHPPDASPRDTPTGGRHV